MISSPEFLLDRKTACFQLLSLPTSLPLSLSGPWGDYEAISAFFAVGNCRDERASASASVPDVWNTSLSDIRNTSALCTKWRRRAAGSATEQDVLG